jgi:glutamate synthase (NADPH/NADH) small chain
VLTKRAIGENGKVTGLECVRVEWGGPNGRKMQEVPGSEFTLKADLDLPGHGLCRPAQGGPGRPAGVALDRAAMSPPTCDYKTSEPKVFACGDMRRGQSLVVWAIREGRQCARAVDEALMGCERTAALLAAAAFSFSTKPS